jgi:hypothetical protein
LNHILLVPVLILVLENFEDKNHDDEDGRGLIFRQA